MSCSGQKPGPSVHNNILDNEHRENKSHIEDSNATLVETQLKRQIQFCGAGGDQT